ncbi:uncharacterized protein LOC103929626 [Pyrus x bretschneideri]|uniref:uncharacterized protein LOC103929626 n=1 Tax=Pyrus x bretschneideri TaxID=225117 RepID=UPI002030DD9A|nr:uncharacterized protein LOC103929626 [Pyrus x bretschneideri]
MAVSLAFIVPVRSISLPSRLNPKSQKIESDLNKLKTSKFSSSLVSEDLLVGLSGLAELYNCIEELVLVSYIVMFGNRKKIKKKAEEKKDQHREFYREIDLEREICFFLSPVTQQALRHQQCKAIVEEALDGSVGLLDSCGSARDILLTMKEHVQNIQSALRRRTGDSSIETTVHSYICFRKKAKKSIAKSLRELKKMETDLGSFHLLDCDHGVLLVLKLLRELSDVTISIFQSLFMFLSTPVASTTGSKWSLVSKLMAAKFAATEKGQTVYNEVGSVDVALCSLHGNIRSDAKIDVLVVQWRLDTLDCSISSLDAGLEIFFRYLLRHRVSLLKVLTP